MTVVALSYAYPPLRYPRAIQVARLVAHLDEDVHVVCADEPGAPHDPSLERAYADAAPVTRVAWTRGARLAQRVRDKVLEDRVLVPDRFRPWQRGAVAAARPLIGPDDVLVTFGQPMSDHLAGLRLLRSVGVPWIAHFSDPWVDSALRHAGRATRTLNERLERAVIERADAVVFTSDATVELVMRKYPDALRQRVHVVPHAFDPALYPEAEPEPGLLRYVGNFYGNRGPKPLFDALRRLDGVRVEIVGSSEQPIEDAPPGVSVRGAVDYLDSLALMRSSAALLVLDAPGARSVFLPSKLVDYLGAGRPIVALTPPGAAADLAERAGGRVADPSDPAAAAEAIAATLADRAPRPVPEELRREYEAPAVAERMAAVIGAARASTIA